LPIGETIEAMMRFELSVIAAGHCTGWRAMSALSNTFGATLDPMCVGKRYRFGGGAQQSTGGVRGP
jgi:7,8-dihydropterin-6-yl-methyl-4-(beta-D-ribofuranosyl)aminobenzene 5'-phosphate synthase